jgi:hypothetical protein
MVVGRTRSRVALSMARLCRSDPGLSSPLGSACPATVEPPGVRHLLGV